MKVKVLSDLHLEFGDIDPGKGEVLILAGDICTVNELSHLDNEYRDRYLHFFEKCCANYDKVFYTMGNHEHYNFDFTQTEAELRYWLHWLPDNITLLNNEFKIYKGWAFFGSTFWTNFNNLDVDVMENCKYGMNDYRIVTHDTRILEPLDTFGENKLALSKLEEALSIMGENVFVFTHHAPSYQSMTNEYRADDVKGAYANHMEEFIENNPSIKYWAHGHVHESNNYMVGGCNVISNPRGYYPDGENPNFNNNMEIEL